jgi:hypothetical protein
MSVQCHRHRPKEPTAGSSESMTVGMSSAPETNRGIVSFCRNCVILSQEASQSVMSSSQFQQPFSYRPI